MRIRRNIVIRTILSLSFAGSILAGSVCPLMATQASTASVVAAAPFTWYHT
jgi:hypothetical protein